MATDMRPTYPYPQLDDDDTTDSAGMSRVLDCAMHEINQKFRDGVLPRHGRDRYYVWEGVRNYIRFLRDRLANKENKDASKEASLEAAQATYKFRTAQERLTSLKADQLAGKLVNVDEIEAAWVDTMTSIRQGIMAIPGRFRFRTPHMTATDQQVLETICRDVLEELASGPPPTPNGDG